MIVTCSLALTLIAAPRACSFPPIEAPILSPCGRGSAATFEPALATQTEEGGQEGEPQPPAEVESASAVQAEPLLKAGDHKKLVKALADYFEAKTDDKGILEALTELEETIAELEKRLDGQRLVTHLVDFERAILEATDLKDSVKGKGKVATLEVEQPHWDDTIPYALQAPKAYKVKDGPYPLVLIVPTSPKDREGSKDLEQVMRDDWLESAMPEEAVVVLCGMPADEKAWTELGSPGVSGGIANVLQILGEVNQTYSIDPDRIVLVGQGTGATAALAIGARYPHVFAGVVTRSGDPEGVSAVNYSTLPTLLLGGGTGATAFHAQTEELGYGTSSIEAEVDQKNLWEWIKSARRDANPTKIVYSPEATFAKEAYWLKVDGYDPAENPQIEARIDRENGLIEITGTGFYEIFVSLNDRLLDLDRPVRVTINGTEHESVVRRSMAGMINRAFASGDAARLYVAELQFPFTAAAAAE